MRPRSPGSRATPTGKGSRGAGSRRIAVGTDSAPIRAIPANTEAAESPLSRYLESGRGRGRADSGGFEGGGSERTAQNRKCTVQKSPDSLDGRPGRANRDAAARRRFSPNPPKSGEFRSRPGRRSGRGKQRPPTTPGMTAPAGIERINVLHNPRPSGVSARKRKRCPCRADPSPFARPSPPPPPLAIGAVRCGPVATARGARPGARRCGTRREGGPAAWDDDERQGGETPPGRQRRRQGDAASLLAAGVRGGGGGRASSRDAPPAPTPPPSLGETRGR